MIGKKAMSKLQRRLLRTTGITHHTNTERAGLTISDYDMLCRAHAARPDKPAAHAGSGRSLILK